MSDWADAVLDFWFGLDPRQWWRGGAALDARVTELFRDLHDIKRRLPAHCFIDNEREALGAVVLFDQFPRNMFRDHADQFMTDTLALQVAKMAIERDLDDRLSPAERGFLYMPFQHSEQLDDQRRSIALFTALGDDFQLGFAKKHRDIIERFGRFPHRNAMLGRAPRPDEIAAGDVVPW